MEDKSYLLDDLPLGNLPIEKHSFFQEILFGIIFAICILVSFIGGAYITEQRMQQEAINAGVAHRDVDGKFFFFKN